MQSAKPTCVGCDNWQAPSKTINLPDSGIKPAQAGFALLVDRRFICRYFFVETIPLFLHYPCPNKARSTAIFKVSTPDTLRPVDLLSRPTFLSATIAAPNPKRDASFNRFSICEQPRTSPASPISPKNMVDDSTGISLKFEAIAQSNREIRCWFLHHRYHRRRSRTRPDSPALKPTLFSSTARISATLSRSTSTGHSARAGQDKTAIPEPGFLPAAGRVPSMVAVTVEPGLFSIRRSARKILPKGWRLPPILLHAFQRCRVHRSSQKRFLTARKIR